MRAGDLHRRERQALLVAEVNTVEERRDGTWIVASTPVTTSTATRPTTPPPLALVKVGDPLAPPAETVNVAGNINEANDVFARSLRLLRIDEGDLVALYPAGAYGASMASDHCLRGLPAEVLV